MMRALIHGLLAAVLCWGAAAGAEQTLTELPERPPAPDFTLEDMDGNSHSLSDYRGQAVIVNFWATWCPPCREEMPSMQRGWEQVRDEDIALLAVNVGETADQIFVFTADYPVEFPLLLDRDGSVTDDWPVKGLPTTFVVDPEGRIVYRAVGGRAWDDPALLDQVRSLVDGG